MQGEGIERADRLQPAMRRPAVAHIVFGVDFEKSEIGPLRENLFDVVGFQADAAAFRQGRGDAGGEAGEADTGFLLAARRRSGLFAGVFAPGAPRVTGRPRRV